MPDVYIPQIIQQNTSPGGPSWAPPVNRDPGSVVIPRRHDDAPPPSAPVTNRDDVIIHARPEAAPAPGAPVSNDRAADARVYEAARPLTLAPGEAAPPPPNPGGVSVTFVRSAPAISSGDTYLPPSPAQQVAQPHDLGPQIPSWALPPWMQQPERVMSPAGTPVSNESHAQLLPSVPVVDVNGDVRFGGGGVQPPRVAGQEDVQLGARGGVIGTTTEVLMTPAAEQPLSVDPGSVAFGGKGKPKNVKG